MTDAKLALAHLDRMASLSREQESKVEEIRRLRTQISESLSAGDRFEALRLAQQVATISSKVWGEEDIEHVRLLQELMWGYIGVNDDLAGKRVAERVLNLQRRLRGRSHPGYVESLENLVNVCSLLGDEATVSSLLAEAYAVTERVFGQDDYRCARLLWLQGISQAKQERYKAAEGFFRKSLRLSKRLGPQGSRWYAEAMLSMARIYYQRGHYGEALRTVSEAETLFKRYLAHDPRCSEATMFKGIVYHRLGDYERAVALLTQAMGLAERTQTVIGSRCYLRCCAYLANVYVSAREYDRAESLLKETLTRSGEMLGKDHYDYGCSLLFLGQLYQKKGNYVEAEQLLKEAMTIDEKFEGSGSLAWARSSDLLGFVYVEMKEYARAAPLLLRAEEIRRKKLRKDHPEYAVSLVHLGALYLGEGKLQKAEESLVEAIQIYEKSLGDKHPELVEILETYGKLLRSAKRDKDAQQAESRAQRIRARVAQQRSRLGVRLQ